MGGGGVDGAIHNAGGPQILKECIKIRETEYPQGLPTGKAVVTQAGELPCKYVIHTVGPVWKGGGANEEELLASAYNNSLKKSVEIKAESIAFPAISTGIYGFPKNKAAKIVWKVIVNHILEYEIPKTIILVFFSLDNLNVFLKNEPKRLDFSFE